MGEDMITLQNRARQGFQVSQEHSGTILTFSNLALSHLSLLRPDSLSRFIPRVSPLSPLSQLSYPLHVLSSLSLVRERGVCVCEREESKLGAENNWAPIVL